MVRTPVQLSVSCLLCVRYVAIVSWCAERHDGQVQPWTVSHESDLTSSDHHGDPFPPLPLPAADATFKPNPLPFTPPFTAPAASMHADLEDMRQPHAPYEAPFPHNCEGGTAGTGNVQLQVTVQFADHESRLGFLNADSSSSAPEGVHRFAGVQPACECPMHLRKRTPWCRCMHAYA